VSIFTALAIYFVIWWVTLFAVLPWGVRSQHEAGEMTPGTDPGAPVLANVKLKLIWTTIVATVVFAAWFGVYYFRLITIDQIAAWFGITNLGGTERRHHLRRQACRPGPRNRSRQRRPSPWEPFRRYRGPRQKQKSRAEALLKRNQSHPTEFFLRCSTETPAT
jgi:predicted secreted protein